MKTQVQRKKPLAYHCLALTKSHCMYVLHANKVIQWNPSIADTIGNQHFVPYSEVSLTQGLPVGVVCVIQLLSGYVF